MPSMKMGLSWLKEKSRALKKDVLAIYLACKHPDLPWYVKIAALLVAGYALSPIDLIPDFIPVLGYLDDLILLPLGISLVIRMIPARILDDSRIRAGKMFNDSHPQMLIAGVIIILIWVVLLALIALKIMTTIF